MAEMEERLKNNPDTENEEEGFLSFLLASGNMSRDEIYANISELMLGAVDTVSDFSSSYQLKHILFYFILFIQELHIRGEKFC